MDQGVLNGPLGFHVNLLRKSLGNLKAWGLRMNIKK